MGSDLTAPEVRAAAEPAGRLTTQPWMTDAATVAVMKAIAAGGKPPRFVGGCVRDALANRPVQDVDIATPEPPSRVMELLQRAGIKAVPTGIKHGTVTAVVDRRPFEITTLRLDVESDGRHATVAFTDDWTADAARRDFTINAMSATLAGDVYDPFGGIDDLAAGRVRFVGNAHQRIEEDVLRILRFFRFQARFGRPPADPEAMDACRSHARLLPTLSGERVRTELFKITLSPDPADAFGLMLGVGVFENLLPQVRDLGRLRIMAWLDSQAMRLASVAPDALRRLVASFAAEPDVEAVTARLKLSNEERRRLEAMARPRFTVSPELDGHAVRVLLYRHGAVAVRDLALLAWATERAAGGWTSASRSEEWLAILRAAEAWTPKRLPIRGEDIARLGLPPGPRLGAVLKDVEKWWIDTNFEADREACLAYARNRIEFGRPEGSEA